MNLKDLFDATPTEQHGNIKVKDGHVFVRDVGGSVTEYLLLQEGELWEVRSASATPADNDQLRKDIQAIKKKLGI